MRISPLPPPLSLNLQAGQPPLADFPHIEDIGSHHFRRGLPAERTHCHKGIEIHYVWRGRYHWTVQDQTYFVHAGDAFVTCPWHWHGSTGGAQETGCYSWTSIIPEGFGRKADLRLGGWTWLSPAAQTAIGRVLTRAHLLPNATEVGAVMHQLVREYGDQGLAWKERLNAILTDLLLVTARAAESIRPRPEDTVLAALHAAITNDLQKPWPIDALCAVVGLSPISLRRRLSACCGLSPTGLVAHLRIEAACRLLKAGRPIVDVAYACGFSSQQHLSTRFREACGLSPRAFRLAHGAFR
jgi:AraC-like DNA-binding protein